MPWLKSTFKPYASRWTSDWKSFPWPIPNFFLSASTLSGLEDHAGVFAGGDALPITTIHQTLSNTCLTPHKVDGEGFRVLVGRAPPVCNDLQELKVQRHVLDTLASNSAGARPRCEFPPPTQKSVPHHLVTFKQLCEGTTLRQLLHDPWLTM